MFWQNRTLVRLYWSGYYIPCTHQRNPTTARRWRFELLDVSPGPYRTYLDNLATLGSPRVSMLTPSLVRTPVQRDTKCNSDSRPQAILKIRPPMCLDYSARNRRQSREKAKTWKVKHIFICRTHLCLFKRNYCYWAFNSYVDKKRFIDGQYLWPVLRSTWSCRQSVESI